MMLRRNSRLYDILFFREVHWYDKYCHAQEVGSLDAGSTTARQSRLCSNRESHSLSVEGNRTNEREHPQREHSIVRYDTILRDSMYIGR